MGRINWNVCLVVALTFCLVLRALPVAFLHEPAPVALTFQATVGLTFAVLVPSACNLTDQSAEARKCVLNENDTG